MLNGFLQEHRRVGSGAEAGAVAEAGADAGAGMGAWEMAIFRAREGAGGHQMRGGWGLSQCMCDRDMETETRRFGRTRQDYPGGLFKALSVQAS